MTGRIPWRRARLEVVADGGLGDAGGRTLYLCAAPPGHAFDPGRRPLGVLMSVPVGVPAAGPGC